MARRLGDERKDALETLERAVAAVPEPSLAASLQRVAEELPLATSVELAAIRVRDAEAGGLHLLAGVGFTIEWNRFTVEPLTLPRMRAILALGVHHSVARALGLRWLHGTWLGRADEIVGTLVVGTRTARTPDESDIAVIEAVGDRLGERLAGVQRTRRLLQRASAELQQSPPGVATPGFDLGPLDRLRPRERAVLELYADGLTTSELAERLVISPHTVRTHVKNALQRLGLHSREDAEELVRANRFHALL
jgi:DNA-binding CsgD family transcriptional regulator